MDVINPTVTYKDVEIKVMLRHPRAQIDQVLQLAIEAEEAAHIEAHASWLVELPKIQAQIDEANAHNTANPEEPVEVPKLPEEPVIDLALRRRFYRVVIPEVDHELTTQEQPARTEYDDETRMVYHHPATVAHTQEHIDKVKRNRFKAQRAVNVESITVDVDNMVFDGDELSQQRMARAVLLMTRSDEKTLWTLADNTQIEVTKAQLKQACLLAAQKQTELWVYPEEV